MIRQACRAYSPQPTVYSRFSRENVKIRCDGPVSDFSFWHSNLAQARLAVWPCVISHALFPIGKRPKRDILQTGAFVETLQAQFVLFVLLKKARSVPCEVFKP
jgi:hypothetical protein